MSSKIIISPELALPIDIVTLRTAIYGTSGAGKTTWARLLAEKVHAAGQRFCAIDLKNDWWGLKSSADGKSEGLPIVIFGGPKKDVQIFPDGGRAVAETVVSIEQSCIIDLDDFSKKKQLVFLTAFLEALYELNRRPLLLFPDEADRYASQKPMSPEMNDSLSASEDIARRGRKRGIGSCWLTQRYASLNKNVSDLCDLTVVFRTPGSRDLDELKERVGRVANKEQVAEVMRAAPGLEDGQAIFLSANPKLRKFMPANAEPMQLPMPWTFDSSATPAPGQRKREPKVLAKTDLAEIEQRMAAQVERAKADDPKELRKKVAELQTTIRMQQQVIDKQIERPTKEKRVEVPVLKDGQLTRLEKIHSQIQSEVARNEANAKSLAARFDELLQPVRDAAQLLSLEKQSPVSGPNLRAPGSQLASSTSSSAGTVPRSARPIPERSPAGSATSPGSVNNPRPTPAGADNERTGAKQRILDEVGKLHRLGVSQPTIKQVAVFCGVSHTTGSFLQNVRDLDKAGYVARGKGTVSLTSLGEESSDVSDLSGLNLLEMWLRKLDGARAKMLNTILELGSASKSDLAQALAVSPTTGSFLQNLRDLRNYGVVEIDNGIARPSRLFFSASIA